MMCEYCGRERDIKKINEVNWKRHVSSCKLKFKGGSKRLDTLNYFFKTTKPCITGEYLLH